MWVRRVDKGTRVEKRDPFLILRKKKLNRTVTYKRTNSQTGAWRLIGEVKSDNIIIIYKGSMRFGNPPLFLFAHLLFRRMRFYL